VHGGTTRSGFSARTGEEALGNDHKTPTKKLSRMTKLSKNNIATSTSWFGTMQWEG